MNLKKLWGTSTLHLEIFLLPIAIINARKLRLGGYLTLIDIELMGWEQFNARADRTNYSWFRFQNDFFTDQRIFGLGHLEKILYVFLICMVSKKNSGVISLNPDYICSVLNIKQNDMLKSIEILNTCGLIICAATNPRLNAVITPSNGRPTLQTDITDRQTLLFDFDFLYQKYPKKIGKQKGLAIAKRDIKSQEDFEALSRAIDRYQAHLNLQRTESKFIKQFDTFMHSWRDWEDPTTGSITGVNNGFKTTAEILAELDEKEKQYAAR